MAQHHQHQPPKASVEIVHSADKDLHAATSFNEISAELLKQVKDNLPFHEAHQNKLKELEGLMQSVINNQADVKKELEQLLNTKQKHVDYFAELKKSLSTTQKKLETHEKETLASITAMLGHTTQVKNLIADLTTRVDKLEVPETPRITNVVENEQKRNSELEKSLKLLTEKFNNLVQNIDASQKEANQKKEISDAQFIQEQAAKDATLKNILKEMTDLSSTVATQGKTINDQKQAFGSLLHSFRLSMAANVMALCATILIWWQAHKA